MPSAAVRHSLYIFVAGFFIFNVLACGADVPPPTLPDLTSIAWLTAAEPVLKKASVAMDGITLAPVNARSQKGDTTTILVQATEGKSVRQWAVVLSINPIKPEEEKLRSPALVIHLSNGHDVDFTPTPPQGMLIHVLGPFSEVKGAAKAKDIWSGSLINPQFLGLGIDGAAVFWRRLYELGQKDPDLKSKPFDLNASTNPFPTREAPDSSLWLQKLAMTKAEERAFAGLVPSLESFFQIASQASGVKEIVFEAVDIPWMSIALHGGRVTDTNFQLVGTFDETPAALWGLPTDTKVYTMGVILFLQGKPALNCRFAVTSPRIPLLNTAGIIGLAAMRPDGKGPHLMLRVQAAHPSALSQQAHDSPR